jgi:hypothetical protein
LKKLNYNTAHASPLAIVFCACLFAVLCTELIICRTGSTYSTQSFLKTICNIIIIIIIIINYKLRSWVLERTLLTEQPQLLSEIVPNFADRWCHVVSVTYPYGCILDFLDRSRYFLFQVAPQLYSRGWVDLVPDPLFLGKSGIAGNRTRTSGSVAMSSEHSLDHRGGPPDSGHYHSLLPWMIAH